MRRIFLAALPLAAWSENISEANSSASVEDNELFAWVKKMGGSVDPRVELSTGPDPSWNVRGLFATAPIAAGEEIVYLPASSQICNPTMCGLIAEIRQELVAKEKSSHWPYLKAMETHDIDFPNVWTEEERSLLVGLQPSDWTRHINWFEWECWPTMSEQLAATDANISSSVLDALTLRALLLYVARITTVHSFDSAEYCFIPIYDAMNHRNGVDLNTAWASKSTPHVTISTTKNVPAGGQLWNSFGDGAARMFRDYGFLEQNPTDWNVQFGDASCTWTLTDQDDGVRVDWKELADNDQCLTILQDHLATLPSMPEITESMRPSRVGMAKQFRENYINAIELGIKSLTHNREEL